MHSSRAFRCSIAPPMSGPHNREEHTDREIVYLLCDAFVRRISALPIFDPLCDRFGSVEAYIGTFDTRLGFTV
jgi:hypothetical protein